MIQPENKEDFENFSILYMESHPEVYSIGIGNKTKNGQVTDEISVIFGVKEKKQLSELLPEEIIPLNITINDQNFPSDVIETPNKAKKIACFDWNASQPGYGSTGLTEDQLAHRARKRPLIGGISISAVNNNQTNTPNNLYSSVGTLGCLVVDNEDGSIVGLTSAHVVCETYLSVENRLKLYNFNTSDDIVIQPSLLESFDGTSQSITDLYNNREQNNIGKIKRYSETNFINNFQLDGYKFVVSEIPKNYVDAALVHINSGGNTISSVSSGVLGLLTDNFLPFATTYELDRLLQSFNAYSSTSMSGRTSGAQIDCYVIKQLGVTASLGITQEIPYGSKLVPSTTINLTRTVYYSDLILLEGNLNIGTTQEYSHPAVAGDSGSVLTAVIDDIEKIIGIIFLATDPTLDGIPIAYACRIDRIMEKLNISEWNGIINYSNPNNWQYLTRPIEISDPENPSAELQNKITVNNKTYWRIGTTNTSIP
jgi:hypothetical protein